MRTVQRTENLNPARPESVEALAPFGLSLSKPERVGTASTTAPSTAPFDGLRANGKLNFKAENPIARSITKP